MMKNIAKISVLLALFFVMAQAHACMFGDPPETRCTACGALTEDSHYTICDQCDVGYFSCVVSHACGTCPGCGEVGEPHPKCTYQCCGVELGCYTCQQHACMIGIQPHLHLQGGNIGNVCPNCGGLHYTCQPCGSPDPDPPPPPSENLPINPGDPPIYNPDPPGIIFPPDNPGDPPGIVPVPPGTTLPTVPGDPPVVIMPPPGGGNPPVIVLPPPEAGDPPGIVPVPPGTTLPTVPGDPPVVIMGENGNPNVIIEAPEAEGESPVVSYTYGDPAANNEPPEDPTQENPGEEPPEPGEPDPTPTPQTAKFYFSRINQQAITRPVGTTYTVDLPMSVYAASTTGTAPGDITIYLHCVPDEVTSGATYDPAVTSAKLKSFTPPAPPLLLFGRSLYPNMTSSKGGDTWHPEDEFLLILSTDPDSEDAIAEVENCCNGAGCRYHLKVKFRDGTAKPGR